MPGIFLIQNDGRLVEMTEHAYDSENLLQELLAHYPSLLAGDQMDSASPRRWLLVTREAGLASEEGCSDRWSVDHLFLDQDAVPTIVEVKRSSDTRIRREVVGQMLDYAANGVVYWPVEKIRAQFEAGCAAVKAEPGQVLADFLGPEADQEKFWLKVKTNLQAGKVRMVFVADEIPPELRRVVEFLNAQMDPAEVLAVEIRQFVGEGLKTLVPRVIGQTIEAQTKKAVGSGEARQWDEASFFVDLEQRKGPAAAAAARRLLDWARERKLRLWWGRGKSDGSFVPVLDLNGERHYTITVWTYGSVELMFQYMKTRKPFDDEEKRREVLRKLNGITGVRIAEDRIDKRPTIQLGDLAKDGKAVDALLEVVEWMLEEVKTANS